MKKGIYLTKKPPYRRNRTKAARLICLVILLGCTVGGTVAYLATQSSEVSDSFVPGYVGCEVVNSGSRTFTVKPDSSTNTDVYLRVAVVANWVSSEGIHWQAPKIESVTGEDWVKSENYYYYTKAVSPGGAAAKLTVNTSGSAPAGCTLQIKVMGEAIQADGTVDGTKAVVDAWGVDPSVLATGN